MSLTKASEEVHHAKKSRDLTGIITSSVSRRKVVVVEATYPNTNPPIDTNMPIQNPFHVNLGSGVLS
jgi:hypothetical protein